MTLQVMIEVEAQTDYALNKIFINKVNFDLI